MAAAERLTQSGYTGDVNAIIFPSGDHLTISAPVESLVSACASPPAIESKYTCESPLREERNASVFPSGDHTAKSRARSASIASPLRLRLALSRYCSRRGSPPCPAWKPYTPPICHPGTLAAPQCGAT